MTTPPPADQSGTAARGSLRRSLLQPSLGPQSDSRRRRLMRSTLVLHFRPPSVNEKTLRLSLSWGLGGMAVTLVLLQMATGLLLKFVYVPTPVEAYASVQTIVGQIPFGRLVRNLHHWSANGLVIVVSLHLLRVFFTGAFHPPRQFNWLIGLAALGLILAANLTGYLLPYDQLAYWAITVISAMLGYLPAVGGALQRALAGDAGLSHHTLPFFYALHTAVVPLLLTALMGLHFWRIRRAGGLVVPRKPSETVDEAAPRVAVYPHLLVREIAMALAVTASLLIAALLADAPLAGPANPGLSPNPVRAPWYFAGFQELLLHFHPSVAVSVIPLLIGAFLVSVPYLAYPRSTAGIWFASNSGRRQARIAVSAALVMIPLLIIVDSHFVKTATWAAGLAPIVRDGLLPVLLLGGLTAGAVWILMKRYRTPLNEVIQSLVIFLMTALLVLTVVGIFFRGPYMKLTWPF